MAHVACHCESIIAADHAARLRSSSGTGSHGGGARYCLKHIATKKSVPFLQYGHATGVGTRQAIFSVFSQTVCGAVGLVSSSDDLSSLSRRRLEGAKIP